MIMFWNRKEVFVGYSLQKFSEVRALLSANKIDHTYQVVNGLYVPLAVHYMIGVSESKHPTIVLV